MSGQIANFASPSSLASPRVVVVAGVILIAGCILIPRNAIPDGILPFLSTVAFLINVYAVSIPGRLDDFDTRSSTRQQSESSGQPKSQVTDSDVATTEPNESTPLKSDDETARYGDEEKQQQQQQGRLPSVSEDPALLRMRTLLAPAGWAFAIWGFVYLGEAIFCTISIASLFLEDSSSLSSSKYLAWISEVPSLQQQVTIPFVAANLLQSLWCVSFRPSYSNGWHTYISCGMLGGTAFALSYVPVPSQDLSASWLLIPMIMHYGWTTAAALVNLNGSIAMDGTASDTTVAVAGHASCVLATLIGVLVAVFDESLTYGLTVAWALAACAVGITARTVPDDPPPTTTASSSARASRGGAKADNGKGKKSIVDLMEDDGDILLMAANIQSILCWTGSVLCAAAALSNVVLPFFL